MPPEEEGEHRSRGCIVLLRRTGVCSDPIETRERQGRSAQSPRLARQRLPWETESPILNTNGVAAIVGRISGTDAATALRLEICGGITQGSAFRATLGWQAQSLRD